MKCRTLLVQGARGWGRARDLFEGDGGYGAILEQLQLQSGHRGRESGRRQLLVVGNMICAGGGGWVAPPPPFK